MIKDGIKYGILLLPEDTLPCRDGYRYGAYFNNLKTGETHVTEFFKTKDEIQQFVNVHREYGSDK